MVTVTQSYIALHQVGKIIRLWQYLKSVEKYIIMERKKYGALWGTWAKKQYRSLFPCDNDTISFRYVELILYPGREIVLVCKYLFRSLDIDNSLTTERVLSSEIILGYWKFGTSFHICKTNVKRKTVTVHVLSRLISNNNTQQYESPCNHKYIILYVTFSLRKKRQVFGGLLVVISLYLHTVTPPFGSRRQGPT